MGLEADVTNIRTFFSRQFYGQVNAVQGSVASSLEEIWIGLRWRKMEMWI